MIQKLFVYHVLCLGYSGHNIIGNLNFQLWQFSHHTDMFGSLYPGSLVDWFTYKQLQLMFKGVFLNSDNLAK